MTSTLRFAAVFVSLVAGPSLETAQPPLRDQLVGHWRLVGTEQVREGDAPVSTMGEAPLGLITYTPDGHMLAQLGPAARPTVRAADATADQVKTLLSTQTSYFGTFTVDERARTVTHHRDGSQVPGERDFVRTIDLQGTRLVLTTPTTVVDGRKRFARITWERVRPAPPAPGFDPAARAAVAGTWALVDHRTMAADGQVRQAFGAAPKGLFVFGPDGYTTVQIVNPDRPSTPLGRASEAEARRLLATYLAYHGTYDVDPATKKIVVHTTADLNAMNTGADQIRFFAIDGDTMVLQPPPAANGSQSRITWRRVRP
ncbi:MAG: lipocalin-like domain-containing protein [Vicinamibacterales bacterium]